VVALRLTHAGAGVSLVKAILPPGLHLADVRGEELDRWSRKDRLVQIWLREPSKQTRLQLKGWMSLDQTPNTARAQLHIGPISFPGLQLESFATKVIPEAGVSLTSEQSRVSKLKEQRALLLEGAAQAAVFQVHEEPPRADVAVLTT